MFAWVFRLRLILLVLGVADIFAAYRYFNSADWFKILVIVGFVCVVLSWLIALLRWADRSSSQELRACWRWPLVWQTMMTLSLSLSATYYRLLGNNPDPATLGMKVLLVAWLLLFILSLFMGIGAELAQLEFGQGHQPEPKRVTRASLSWLMAGMVVAAAVAFNFSGAKLDRSFDWSYLKVTKPSDATTKTLGQFNRDLEVLLFFPRNNEIAKFVNEYFSGIKANNSHLKIKQVDKDLNPVEAQKYKVHANGSIVIVASSLDKKTSDTETAEEKAAEMAGETASDKENAKPHSDSKRIDIGLTVNAARKNLASLDKNFRAAFLSLVAKEKIAYFMTGHGEADWHDEKDAFISINGLYQGLKASNFKVKRLGIQEGSMEKVPDDATAVIIAGPQKSFAKEEVQALETYLAKGGRLLVALDVNQNNETFSADRNNDPLLQMLKNNGLEYKFEVLADEQKHVRARNDISDRAIIFSNALSSHESMSQLAKLESRLAIIFARSGYFVETKDKEATKDQNKSPWVMAEMLRSLSTNFNDLNNNYQFDGPQEKKASYILAAALTLKTEDTASGQANKKDQSSQGRIVALADASVFADALITNPANGAFLSEAFSWLVDSPEISGATESEEDVKIMLKHDQELLFYYGTLFGPPLVVMIAALVVLKRPRKKS